MSDFNGATADGIEVRVEGHDNYPTARVWVGGVQREVFHASRLRDGGTTRYVCDGGTLTLPHRIGGSDRTPRWTPGPASSRENS